MAVINDTRSHSQNSKTAAQHSLVGVVQLQLSSSSARHQRLKAAQEAAGRQQGAVVTQRVGEAEAAPHQAPCSSSTACAHIIQYNSTTVGVISRANRDTSPELYMVNSWSFAISPWYCSRPVSTLTPGAMILAMVNLDTFIVTQPYLDLHSLPTPPAAPGAARHWPVRSAAASQPAGSRASAATREARPTRAARPSDMQLGAVDAGRP